MKLKNNKIRFICQISETTIKVIKCLYQNNSSIEILAFEAVPIPSGNNETQIIGLLSEVFKKLDYKNNPIVLSLPRNSATCRIIKVPTQIPEEIEKMVALQATKYLPYPVQELITGYQIIENDPEGYCSINLVIVHKEAIEQKINLFKSFKPANISIILSSFGILNLYNLINPNGQNPVMVIDIDLQQAEILLIKNSKLLFSRYIKLNLSNANWEDSLIEEIKNTNATYIKESQVAVPEKIVIICSEKVKTKYLNIPKNQFIANAEVLSYENNTNLAKKFTGLKVTNEDSFSSVLGLSFSEINPFLNLLPEDTKKQNRNINQKKEIIRIGLLITGVILIFSLAIAKNLNNKAVYLKRLNNELNKIKKDAQPLEEIENRIRLMDKWSHKRLSSLDILSSIAQVLPLQTYLTNLIYEENKEVILQGQAIQLNLILQIVSKLELLPVFKDFNVKVRYATQRKIQNNEIIDFEISCLKKK